ncbi:DUF6252 family protein [uncultured Psychroserpens sp.]|uniref:DUF6252 family protein n=1 Tax=uncultured Psychroserpens sp. TaxID=255436 RepID=UPI002617ECDC|nr:DUF6252 family protein [uncultured Psychroserpens sp.]
MKRLAILLVTVFTLVSCGDEVEFNSPGFQGNREYGLWRAEFTNAVIDDNGFLVITASNNSETVILKLPSVNVGTYVLGNVNSREGRYIDGNGTVFSTNNPPDPSVSIYPELGFVKIDEVSNNTFTGTFEFLAFDESGLNSIGYNEGVFFRVPLIAGTITSGAPTCEETEAASANALTAYESTFASTLEYIDSDAYINACNLYTQALQSQKSICGDTDGSIQTLIDNLNDCVFPCTLATQNRDTAQATFEAATIANYIDACENYRTFLEEQIEFCGDTDGSIQAIIDGLDCNDDDSDGVPNNFEDFDGDGDLTNDDTDGDGIPNYMDDDDDGDGVLTIDEAKDADGNPADTDGDTDVDYLDNDDDGDGIFTQFETGDTDGDGTADYLDNDDDGDGTLTADENADPNMDGDPADAVDTDADTIPDYLDDM